MATQHPPTRAPPGKRPVKKKGDWTALARAANKAPVAQRVVAWYGAVGGPIGLYSYGLVRGGGGPHRPI